ncbi:hypothetical protein [Azonexus sp.]|uniref:hypothetical protein n=1 Tax=Azonexus sp. TaxID=1872668 RepID=UPI0035AFCA30
MSTAENYVQELALATELLPLSPAEEAGFESRASTAPLDEASDQASLLEFGMNLMERRQPKPPPAVDANALLSFVVGVTPQEREDALYSVQLASRSASALFDRFKDTEAWYGKYIETLEKLGWTSEQFAFSKYEQAEGELRMDQAALAVIAAIATQNQLAVLNQSLDALKALAEEDGAIRLFDFHTTAESSGNFQIGAVQKSEDGVISMALGAFHFTADDQRRRFLFLSWGERSVQLWTAAQKMTFNAKHYARLRDAVEDKLGDAAELYIGELEIA